MNANALYGLRPAAEGAFPDRRVVIRADGLRRDRVEVVEPAPRRGDVYLISLNPTQGRELKKSRPCLVVSPDELNAHPSTLIVAPMTTGGHPYPFRIACRFHKKDGYIVLE